MWKTTGQWEETTTGVITPDDLPAWVPGESTLVGAALGWESVRVRRWRYAALDVPIPGLSPNLRDPPALPGWP